MERLTINVHLLNLLTLRGCHFGQKVDLGDKNTFYSQSVLHHFLSISQFLDFLNLILNSYFEVTFVTCQDGWVVRALDSHARDPWFKSHWQQAFLLRKGFQKFFKKWLSPMWKWWDISSSSIMAISSLRYVFVCLQCFIVLIPGVWIYVWILRLDLRYT